MELVGSGNAPTTLSKSDDYMTVLRVTSPTEKIRMLTVLGEYADVKTYSMNKLVLAKT